MRTALRRGVAAWRRQSLDLLFPPQCANCDAEMPCQREDLLLCDRCRGALGPENWPCCGRCGAGVASQADPCEPCRRSRHRQWSFDRVVPLGPYRDALRGAVLKMKRRAGDPLSAAIARLFAQRRGAILAGLDPDLVAAVPMYWTRRLFRGTNSPEILARHLARHLGIPLARGMLIRCRNTLPQADLPPGKRFQNVLGAFRLGAPYDLRSAKVVLVDDILTSGATCSEAAKVFKQAGAAMVVAAVVARAEGPRRG